MFAKSLIIFTSVGIVAGLLLGVYLIDVKNTSQLVYVEGFSLSVVTEKSDFKKKYHDGPEYNEHETSAINLTNIATEVNTVEYQQNSQGNTA